MMKRLVPCFPIAFLLLLVLSFCSFASFAAPPIPLSEKFVQCLETRTNISNKAASKIVYSPKDASYASLLQAYIRNKLFNTSSTPKPSIIVTPFHESHVQGAVICTKQVGLRLSVRSGGHDYEGVSYVSDVPFILLDMFNLRNIVLDIENNFAVVQTGATLGELYHRIWEKSKVHGFPGGVCPSVGVGGHLGGAGYGNMMRKYGLTIDNILDARIVDVNGSILDKASMGDDLFWAIRGGGSANFGVVLSYKIHLVQVPEKVTVFKVGRTLEENATDIIYHWQHVAPSIDDRLFIRVMIEPRSSDIARGQTTILATFMSLFLGRANELERLLNTKFPQLRLKKDDCKEMSWIDSVVFWGKKNTVDDLLKRELNSAEFFRRKADYVENMILKEGLESVWRKMIELSNVKLYFHPYGGRMSRIPASVTAFPHRSGILYKVQYRVNWKEGGAEADNDHAMQIRALFDYMTPFVSKNPRKAYWNYRDFDIGINHHGKNGYEEGKIYGMKYFNENFERLVYLKSLHDPDNFFKSRQSIPSLPKMAIMLRNTGAGAARFPLQDDLGSTCHESAPWNCTDNLDTICNLSFTKQGRQQQSQALQCSI